MIGGYTVEYDTDFFRGVRGQNFPVRGKNKLFTKNYTIRYFCSQKVKKIILFFDSQGQEPPSPPPDVHDYIRVLMYGSFYKNHGLVEKYGGFRV